MLRLIFVAIVAILVSERNQIYAGPNEAPETTEQECWTEWFDRDDPDESGDRETFKDLRKENPGKICSRPISVEAQTVSGQMAPAPGDENLVIWPTIGLICKNKDQSDGMCEDYRVRFLCGYIFCAANWKSRTGPEPIGEVCWSNWFDRSDPSEKGDSELLSDLRNENPGQICAKPWAMEAVLTINPAVSAIFTGQYFHIYNPHIGLLCRNMDQQFQECYDYKVRFLCQCR